MKKIFFILFFILLPSVVYSLPAEEDTLLRVENVLIAIQNQLSASQSYDWNKGMSFLAGLLASIAIVVAASRRD